MEILLVDNRYRSMIGSLCYSPTELANNNQLASSSFSLAIADENESITEAIASKFER